MDLNTLIEICEAYRSLGDAVADQLRAVALDPSEETLCDQNANALRLAVERFLEPVVREASYSDDEDLAEHAEELIEAIQKNIAP
mgnify:CR=1 FL=1